MMMLELIQSLLKNPDGAHWESWIAVLSEAIGNERGWMETFGSLDLDAQFALVTALKDADHPYADALRALTVRHLELIDDPQVRAFLVDDAAEATDRMGDWLAKRRAEVRELIDASARRQHVGYDVDADIIELERRLQRLRASELVVRSAEVDTLEREIHRLVTFEKSLAGYDSVAREAYRAQLDAETGAKAEQRRVVEESIATAIGRRDVVQRQLAESSAQLEEVNRQVDETAAHFLEVATRVDVASRAVEASASALAEAQAHLRTLGAADVPD